MSPDAKGNLMLWRIHKTERVYDGHFKVDKYQLDYEKYNGETTPVLQRELVIRNDAVAVLPYDPVTDQVVFIEQFRIGAAGESQPWLIEIVAGLVDEGESSQEVALRESEEEIGTRPSELIKIAGFYPSPGGFSEWIDIYIGKVDVDEVKSNGGLDHEGEDIKVFSRPAKNVLTMIDKGEVKSAIGIIALQWFAVNHEKIRKKWLD